LAQIDLRFGVGGKGARHVVGALLQDQLPFAAVATRLPLDQAAETFGAKDPDQLFGIGALERAFGELFGVGMGFEQRIEQLEQMGLAESIFAHDHIEPAGKAPSVIGQDREILDVEGLNRAHGSSRRPRKCDGAKSWEGWGIQSAAP
jgi:hypothetical protein